MWFRIGEIETSFGPEHSMPQRLQRGLTAALWADPNQRLTSSAGYLDACEGLLHIVTDDSIEQDWTGHIHRLTNYVSEAGYRSGDYAVYLTMRSARFDALMAMFQAGQTLFGLLLDFQNVHWPDDPDAPYDTAHWDDIAYPRLAMNGFMLRWRACGGQQLATYDWPKPER